jgi:hypothetical protein
MASEHDKLIKYENLGNDEASAISCGEYYLPFYRSVIAKRSRAA